MLAKARRNRTYLFSLWLLLATILGHALVPVGSPLARTTGSAFSTSTADVSLGAARRDARAATEQALEPPAEAVPVHIRIAGIADAPVRTPDRDVAFLPLDAPQPFDARGPPVSTA